MGGQLGFNEALELLAQLGWDVLILQLVGEVNRLLVGLDKGAASWTIRQVRLKRLLDRGLQQLLHVVVQELSNVTAREHHRATIA